MSLKRPTAERFRDTKNYNIYCINCHGSGLNTIKNEFKHQVETGLRRTVFILDLEDIQRNLDSQTRTSKQLRDFKDNQNNHLISAILQNIEDIRIEYDVVTKRINDELKFDLYQYWLKDIEDKHLETLVDSLSLKSKISSNVRASTKGRQNRNSKTSKGARSSKKGRLYSLSGETETVTCMPLVKKEHNRVGQSKMVSKKKYIKDDPTENRLYFIILGSLNEQFYVDLLRRDQPVQGIINFIPAESNYDILLNNNNLRNFILQTLDSINNLVYQLRQETSLKSVGIFTHELPVISKCLAIKYQRDIYDQLTWSVFDIEMLQQQYHSHYYRPFQETDVELPPSVDLHQLYDVAASLSLQGHFQKHSLSGSAADVSTILAYVDSLLNTCGTPENILNEKQIILLSMTDYNLPKSNTVINSLIKSYSSAFVSITKIRKFERLFIEEPNMMLTNMLQYADQDMFRNIYLSCLDCNLWRKYVTSLYPKEPMINATSSSDGEHIDLPGIIKLYTSEDSCCQKILELGNTYDDYQVKELQPNCKLYIFRRIYNSICEHEQLDVIPTRLCYRDFTLFQMEEFLENLITPETRKSFKVVSRKSSSSSGTTGRKSKTLDFEENVFIRPTSLKAIKISTERESEQLQTHREKEQRSNRKRSTQYDKKTSTRLTDEWVGLPPGHHLIKGYNLENIRQEVKSKTSKYLYHHGCIQLYEEKLCFQDMNQTLIFDINKCKVHLSRPRSKESGILNNIRLETHNNVGIRILNEPQECAKVVVNYSNGLSIYYHDMDCEQVWLGEEASSQNEKRRIFTPYGAVVVFYQSDYMIMIMRYNGEIYKLYQYEFPEEEEEEEMMSQFSNSQSTEILDNKAQGDNQKRQDENVQHIATKNCNQGRGDSIIKRKTPRVNKKNPSKAETSRLHISEESVNTNPALSPHSVTNDLKAAIEYELAFLSYISSLYNLSYLHLKMTTSQGRRINLALDGKICEATACKLEEWHDYNVNESYSLRSDGVKMIWTQDVLKCYHKDGTVFTTKTEEGFESLDKVDHEFHISQSSSHQQVEGEEPGNNLKSPTTLNNLPPPKCKKDQHKYLEFLAPEEGEEPEDTRYISYSCSSCLLQHHHYAGVYFMWTTTLCPPQSSVLMEILGIDNIFIYTSKEESPPSREVSSERSSTTDMEIDGDMWNRSVVNVWLGDNLHFTVDQEGCEIFAVMERQAACKEEEQDVIMRDSLTLKVLFKDCLTDVFKYLIKEIATFQNYDGPMQQELYFVEIQGKDCKKLGLEFLKALPESSYYQHFSGNCMIDAKPLKTIKELMSHSIEDYEMDMKKFPRFRTDNGQNPLSSNPEFPMVLTTSIYSRVPLLLRNIRNIYKYIEPFENINFKKMRRKFKQLLDCHLRPQLQLDVKTLYSTNNWRKRHWEHERRKFTETQRLGLYHAMLKHNKYPNYFKFTRDYRGNVEDIDFFEFMQCKCENQEVKRDEIYWKSNRNKPNSKTGNKCLYGTYDN